MTFSAALPLTGLAGFRFLERTQEAQQAVHDNSADVKRNIEYFAENIASIKTADDLLADRRLATVALGAFGLGDELYKKAFVSRILTEGVERSDTLGSRLNNQAYIDMTEAFRFDRSGFPTTGSPDLRDEIISKYLSQSFEIAVGEQDTSLRLALDFKRRAPDNVDRSWYAYLGDSPMRSVLETALNIPTEAAGIDVDKQVELFEKQAQKILGTRDVQDFTDPAILDKIISRFLIIDQAQNGPSASTRGATAVTLLANAASGFGSFSSQSLFQSGF